VKPGGVDLVDDFDPDTPGSDVGGERVLEAGIDPELGEPVGLGLGEVEHHDTTSVVRDSGGDDADPDEETSGVDEAEQFAPGDLLAAVVSPCIDSGASPVTGWRSRSVASGGISAVTCFARASGSLS